MRRYFSTNHRDITLITHISKFLWATSFHTMHPFSPPDTHLQICRTYLSILVPNYYPLALFMVPLLPKYRDSISEVLHSNLRIQSGLESEFDTRTMHKVQNKLTHLHSGQVYSYTYFYLKTRYPISKLYGWIWSRWHVNLELFVGQLIFCRSVIKHDNSWNQCEENHSQWTF